MTPLNAVEQVGHPHALLPPCGIGQAVRLRSRTSNHICTANKKLVGTPEVIIVYRSISDPFTTTPAASSATFTVAV